MFKRTIFALTVAAAAYGSILLAQESATLTLRSGERISAQLVDHGAAGFLVKVGGSDRTIPTGDVAVIDFTGGTMSRDDWAKVTGGQHVVWLRNGETIAGTFYDIGGTTPLRITMKTSAGDRDLSSAEVARIVLSHTDAAASATAGTTGAANTAPPAGGGIVVSGRQPWTSTGITVRRGEVWNFNTTGEIQLSADTNDIAAPAGSKSGRYAATAPLPRNFAGALIGRIGTGAPFPIGNSGTITMPATGQLFLGVNDDGFDDNNGEFRVELTRVSRR
jgi:hypothetical protein